MPLTGEPTENGDKKPLSNSPSVAFEKWEVASRAASTQDSNTSPNGDASRAASAQDSNTAPNGDASRAALAQDSNTATNGPVSHLSRPVNLQARTRWAVGTMKAQPDMKVQPDKKTSMTFAQVVQAKVRVNRWQKMKQRIVRRYTIIKSRGMPPLFGFLGKVSAKGKKALANSIILLIANLFFIGTSAYAFVTIENNETFREKRLGPMTAQRENLIYFLGPEFNPKEDPWIAHKSSHDGWTDAEWKILKGAHETRCFKLDNIHTQVNLWNFWSSFDFSATVLTTIGYGSMSPSTHLGRWFCLIYAIIGIPIMAMYLALFSKGIVAVVQAIITLFSNLMTKVNRNFELSDMMTRVLSLVFLLAGFVSFVCMWSGILNKSNPADSFVKCIYFYVVTLTTVGLGDISMTEAQPFVLIRVLLLFCVGLTLVTAVFNALRSVSAAHTRMLKDEGRRLTNRAQEVVMDKANTFMARRANGDGQLEPLTAADSDKDYCENGDANVETTFTNPEEDNEAGFNSKEYRQFDNKS